MGATADAALDRLAVGTCVGGPGQHRILGRDPAFAAALAPARHTLGEGRRTQDAGLAELHQDAALGVVQPVTGNHNFAKLTWGAAIVASIE